MHLTTWTFWKAALLRALRTALVIAAPYFGAVKFADIPWEAALSATLMGFVASIITSLANLPESQGNQVSWWYAVLNRVVKTFFQSLAAAVGTVFFITDVDWPVILQAAALSAAGSLLMAFITSLPEARQLPSPVQTVTTVNKDKVDVVETRVGVSIASDQVVSAG